MSAFLKLRSTSKETFIYFIFSDDQDISEQIHTENSISGGGAFGGLAPKVSTRAKSSYGTCDGVRRAKSQELMWYEL